jgi:hypothetical protein
MSAGRTRRRPLLVLAVAAFLGAGLVSPIVTGATAASPTGPVRIQIDSITSVANAAPTGTPPGAVPYLLVRSGDTFVVHVSFWDVNNNPASFNKDTGLAISASTGSPTPSTGTALKGNPTADLPTSLATPADRVTITVGMANARDAKTVAPDTSDSNQRFDVQSDIRVVPSTTDFSQGIGGDNNCESATKQKPICGLVLLPAGAASPTVLLSIGPCLAGFTDCTKETGSVVQTLLGGTFSRMSPATLVIKCDKSLCPGTSIQNYKLSYSILGDAALQLAPVCAVKGTVGPAPEVACIDYVNSHRDGSGDTLLYLNFVQDLRGAW